MDMMRKVLLGVAGIALALLGLAGLVLPVLPGLLLLAAAAGCLGLASRRVRARLERYPRYRAAVGRWQAGVGLPLVQRLRLAFWLGLDTLLPQRR